MITVLSKIHLLRLLMPMSVKILSENISLHQRALMEIHRETKEFKWEACVNRLIFLPFSTNGQKRRKKKKGDIQYSLPKEAEEKKRRTLTKF